MILCLDLGTTFGYAVVDPVKKQVVETGRFKLTKENKSGRRFSQLYKWLQTYHQSYKFTQCYYELVRRHIGTDAAHCYGAYRGIMLSWAYDMNMEIPVGLGVGTIKKAATGKGKASKEEMIAAVQELGYLPKDDNEADAIAIALSVLNGVK